MILVSIFGLDQFVVGRYSREATSSLANLFETEENEINFSAPQHLIFHKGVEQTSWHVVVSLTLPHKYHHFQEKVAEYISKTLSLYAINIEIYFQYIEEDHVYYFPSETYEEYLSEDNISEEVSDYDGPDPEEEEDEHHHHSHLEDEEDEEEIYLGDVFAGHEAELAELDKKNKV